MLSFIIPVKSPKVSNSWSIVCSLLERTLRSVCNQTSNQFVVVVVCNRKPEIHYCHPNLHFVEVDFPLPAQQLIEFGLERKFDGRGSDTFAKDLDKGRKVLAGLSYVKRFSPSHTMVVDADDFISRTITEYVNSHSSCTGWYLNQGYLYHEQRDFLQVKFKKFHQTCGSSIIIKYEYYEKLFKCKYVYEHRITKFNNGIILHPLPLFGAIYSVGNGENIFQTIERQNKFYKKYRLALAIKNIFRSRLVSQSLRKEFSFYSVNEWLSR